MAQSQTGSPGGVLDPTRDINWSGVQDFTRAQCSAVGVSNGIGYASGAGGAITQATNKSTGVTINAHSGAITMNGASLANATAVGFTVTNNCVSATDTPFIVIKSGATANSYTVTCDAVANGSFHVSVYNFTGGSLSEALVLNFCVFHGAST
jgi:hypothetical protein